jgi:signal peptidase II
MLSTKKKRWILLSVFLFVVVFDQATKAIVEWRIPHRFHMGTEETFFYFTHEKNPGLVVGIFSDKPVLAMVLPLLALGVLAYLYFHLDPSSRTQYAAFAMVAGGAVGNIIDRLFRGAVVDFLQFHFYFLPDALPLPTERYPAFNVADTAICVGVALLIFTWHLMARREAQNAANAV